MSWSHSVPSSSTKTSPCSVGFIVPASTFTYGSILSAVTSRPRACKIFAIEAEAMPLPTPDITPPTTKIYLAIRIGLFLLAYMIIECPKILNFSPPAFVSIFEFFLRRRIPARPAGGRLRRRDSLLFFPHNFVLWHQLWLRR